MAQQMRIRDQEIIVKKVVQALEEKGLQDVETRFGNDSNVKFLEEEAKELTSLNEKIMELNNQTSQLQKSIDRKVEDFNTSNGLDRNNNGLSADTYSGYSRERENRVYFNFNINWDKKTEIADALAIQTLGSEFNVQDLIASLIAEFS